MARYFRGLQGNRNELLFNQKIYHTRLGRRLPGLVNVGLREIYSPIRNRAILSQIDGKPWVLGGQQFAHLLPARYLRTAIAVVLDLLELDYPDLDGMDFDRSSMAAQLSNINLAQKLVTISEYSKQRIVAHFNTEPSKITVIPVGVDVERFRPRNSNEQKTIRSRLGIPEDAFVVLYVGSEQRRKNLTSLIAGLGQLCDVIPELMFVKIGAAQSSTGRQRLLQDVQIMSDRSRLVEGVTEEALPDWYVSSDLFAYPSVGEGFGVPVLEAMACGVSVITTSCCSIPEITANCAVAVTDPFSPNQWAEVVRELWQAENYRSELGQMGRQRALKFLWANLRQQFIDVVMESGDDI